VKTGGEILLWFLMGCIIVLVVTHAPMFANSITTVGGWGSQIAQGLTTANNTAKQ
jgi:hypothetical protein